MTMQELERNLYALKNKMGAYRKHYALELKFDPDVKAEYAEMKRTFYALAAEAQKQIKTA